jgi:hypothetical protein
MDESELKLSDDLFSIDGEATRPHRQVMAYDQLLACVTALMQSCEGCEKVSVVGVTALLFYTLAKSKRLADFLDAISDERMPALRKLDTLMQVWRPPK